LVLAQRGSLLIQSIVFVYEVSRFREDSYEKIGDCRNAARNNGVFKIYTGRRKGEQGTHRSSRRLLRCSPVKNFNQIRHDITKKTHRDQRGLSCPHRTACLDFFHRYTRGKRLLCQYSNGGGADHFRSIGCGFCLRMIDSTLGPGVAAQYAPYRECGTMKHAVFKNGASTVFRTAWIKRAIPVRIPVLHWAMIKRKRFLVEHDRPRRNVSQTHHKSFARYMALRNFVSFS
jgi:hypothetical protein